MWSWIRRRLGALRRLAGFLRPGDSALVEPVRWRWSDGDNVGAPGDPGDSAHLQAPHQAPPPLVVELAAAALWDPATARAWIAGQSYRPLWLARLNAAGSPSELLGPDGEPLPLAALPHGRWRVAIPGLFSGDATRIESAFLVAASEGIDRLVLGPLDLASAATSGAAESATVEIYRIDRFRPSPAGGGLQPVTRGTLTKRLPAVASPDGGAPGPATFQRGPYESDVALPLPLEVEVFDPSRRRRSGPPPSAPRILVLAPFLARGGAEQTLQATCRELARDGGFEFAFATLAPHRRELGDRRRDFAAFAPLVYSLGDLLHPSAMYGALLSLIDTLDIRLLYNANGSTLFYDFARRLRRDRPELPIVDHLYDHRIGYIEWYAPDLGAVIDCCVAENHAIAETLVAEHAWSRERAPVVWPCGRPDEEIPPTAERAGLRRRLRQELGIADDRLLVLTAARAHPQKRPLDWLRLAERLRDTPFEFVWVGGGDLEQQLDPALAASDTRNARRLPFRADVPELLLAADIACLVSEFEGLPVFLLEALQLGRPFVATEVGDIARVVRPSAAGRVAGAPGDLDALESALREMLDPELRRAAGAAAAAAAADFGVPACAARYGAVFRAAIDAKRTGAS